MIDGEVDICFQVRQGACEIACGAVNVLSADIAIALFADELREFAVFDFIWIHHAICCIRTVHIVVGNVCFQPEGAVSTDKLERRGEDVVFRAERQGLFGSMATMIRELNLVDELPGVHILGYKLEYVAFVASTGYRVHNEPDSLSFFHKSAAKLSIFKHNICIK